MPESHISGHATSCARSTIEAIRQSCDIDKDGHWIWRGRVLSYGAPCMAYKHETRPVRQVVYSLVVDANHPIGLPVMSKCGNPMCVAPQCATPKRNADLMAEAKTRKAKASTHIPQHKGMWGQLMIAGGN